MRPARLSPSARRALVVGSIVASVGIGVPHVADNWDRLVRQGPVFVAVWVALAVVFVGSGGGLATRALSRRGAGGHDDAARARRLLLLNGAAAVGMGVTVVVAAVRLLPVASWPVPIALCLIDIAHTFWSRRYLLVTAPVPTAA